MKLIVTINQSNTQHTGKLRPQRPFTLCEEGSPLLKTNKKIQGLHLYIHVYPSHARTPGNGVLYSQAKTLGQKRKNINSSRKEKKNHTYTLNWHAPEPSAHVPIPKKKVHKLQPNFNLFPFNCVFFTVEGIPQKERGC